MLRGQVSALPSSSPGCTCRSPAPGPREGSRGGLCEGSRCDPRPGLGSVWSHCPHDFPRGPHHAHSPHSPSPDSPPSSFHRPDPQHTYPFAPNGRNFLVPFLQMSPAFRTRSPRILTLAWSKRYPCHEPPGLLVLRVWSQPSRP